jgi:hypothetical protein
MFKQSLEKLKVPRKLVVSEDNAVTVIRFKNTRTRNKVYKQNKLKALCEISNDDKFELRLATADTDFFSLTNRQVKNIESYHTIL